jgi:OmcA/MtrC family decaheme c-type cytochrome
MFATNHGSFRRLLSITLTGLFLAALAGCAGEDGNPGVAGPPGNTGGTGGTGGTGASGTLPLVDSNGISSVKFMTARTSSVTIPADGRPVIVFSLVDENNVARKGLAASAARLVMARLYPSVGGASSEWRAYTNRIATWNDPGQPPPAGTTWPGTQDALQANTETMTAGTFVDCTTAPDPRPAGSVAASCPAAANSGGVYVYKMAKNITAADPNDPTAPAYDATLTHRVGLEFRVYRNAAVTGCAADDTTCSEDSIYIASTNGVYTWRPSDGATSGFLTRDIASNTACDACHDQLNLHGGARSDVQYCVTCHNPYTTDPQTGNSVDFKVMVHKIHRGSQLYGQYQVVGFGGFLFDAREVVFPQDQRNCQTCHREGVTDAPDADHWKSYANKTVCGTCHDGEDPDDPTDFWAGPTAKLDASNRIYSVSTDSTATVQGGHAQVDNTQCLDCHGPNSNVDGGKWRMWDPVANLPVAMFDPEERLAANYKFQVVKVAAVQADGSPGATACPAATRGCRVLPGEFPLVTAKITKCSVAYSSSGTCSGTETAVRLTDPEFGLNSSAAMTGRVAWTTRNFTSTQPAWPTTSGWVIATVGTGASAQAGTWVTAPILRGQAPSIAFKQNLTITAATLANPIVFTTNASHNLQTGQPVTFAYMPGSFAALNGNTYVVTRVSSTTFSVLVDGTAFTAFSGYGGAMYATAIPAGMPPQAANAAVLNADGSYTKALTFPMPATAVGGSAEAFIEGRIYGMSAAQPSFTPIVTRLPIASSAGVVFNFNDASPTARRAIVDVNRCNDCHKNLSLHGGNRTSNTELCATCHNPENVQAGAVDEDEVFDFKHMIHRLHSHGFYFSDGEELLYPGKLNNCEGCHKANTYFPVDPAAVFATSIGSGSACGAVANTSTVSAATSANPIQITTTAAHGWVTGQQVRFAAMPGAFAALNGNTYSITVVNTTAFTVAVNGSAYAAYTSGGTADALTGTTRNPATGAYLYPACVASQSTPADDTAMSPNASICSGCHDSGIARLHMEQNGGNFEATKNANGSTVNPQESCPLCHGNGELADVKRMHRVAEYRYN